MPPSQVTTPDSPTFAQMWRVFGRIGLLSFGGPAAQIALMHKELVEDHQWLEDSEFLSALSFCMLLPGPEAMQLATYSGWKLRGVAGGLLGGLLFVIPGALVIAALALAYGTLASLPVFEALFVGIKATVVIIVLQALIRISQKALKTPDRWVIAMLSFVGIFFLHLPFPAIILFAGAYGAITATSHAPSVAVTAPRRSWHVIGFWTALWVAPIAVLAGIGAEFLLEIALFFSKLALVTFGGAYAVLGYMTQQVVVDHGWITTAQMMDGLGLAETTPGPLILVTQFVGMLAGMEQSGAGLALIAGALVLWVTFIPCFLWIFAGAPYIEWISSQPRLSAALSAITAAVVGVMLNLSVWFALHVFFSEISQQSLGPLTWLRPALDSFQPAPALIALLAGFLLLKLRWSLPLVLAGCSLAGALLPLLA